MDAQTFEKWLQSSRNNDNYVYHTGFLVKDANGNYELRSFANNVLKIANQKMIHLFQKKIKENVYEYRAVRI
jgi:hypothetical protein